MRKPIQHNLTHAILEKLGLAIVTGAYGGDKAFPIEADLCKEFNASRSVLREAVKMLTAKGLLTARPRQGTSIAPEQHWNLLDPDVLRWLLERKFSLDLLADFTEVRLAIEPMSARLAAQHPTPAYLDKMQQAIGRMKAAERGEDDPLASDVAFHVGLLHASGNRFYMQFEELIDTALRISIRLTNQFKGVSIGSVNDHRKVLNAIAAGDGDKAAAAMTAMLSEVMKLIDMARRRSKPAVRLRRVAS